MEFWREIYPGQAPASSRRPGESREPVKHWTPAFAGVTTFHGGVILECCRKKCVSSALFCDNLRLYCSASLRVLNNYFRNAP
jgi:hypothetical protein